MRTYKVIREMRNADVLKVSLVDHASTRIPFHTLKRDGAQVMNQLRGFAGLVRRDPAKKADKPLPSLAAILLPAKPADDEMERVKNVVKAAGFSVDLPVENADGTFLFAQAKDIDFENEQDIRGIQVNSDFGLVMKGFAPWTDSLETFEDILAAQNVYGGLNSACNALTTAIAQKMSNSSDSKEAATEVTAVLEAFSSYVSTLVANIPQAAFKFETAYQPVANAIKVERAQKAEKTAKAAMTKPDDVAQADWDAADDAGKKALCSKSEAAKAAAVEAAKTPAQKSEEANVAAIVAAVSASLEPKFTALGADIASVKTAQAAQATQVTAMKAAQDEMTTKIGGTVLGGARRADTPVNDGKDSRAWKSEFITDSAKQNLRNK